MRSKPPPAGPPIISNMQERAVAQVNIAMTGPAVVAVGRDWGSILTPLQFIFRSAIAAAAFVAVDHLHQITQSNKTE